ncbi:MAG: glutamyl-tRNA reductase [Chloroflexota bacterium]|nr:glutamyl-tRNA reductase [Chloroflexota bacterium]MDE2941002.1 glutamyl-tRNA reductase [Chloroflexota bacterium]MDE3268231.1 glutamyl-tRNA reductase [Chloroflexota bacterium]
MKLFVLGLSHWQTPLDVRESVAFTRGELPQALLELKDALGGGVIVSTCNRTEVYATGEGTRRVYDKMHELLANRLPPDVADPSRAFYFYEHEEAVRHLFRVACGLDSQILGESEVLGQVRDAYGASVAQRCAGGVVSRVFHHTLRVGRRARRETGIGDNALSIGTAAVELTRRTIGDLGRASAAVVGAGEAGMLVAQALRYRGVGRMELLNRTLSRASEAAAELDAEARPLEDLPAVLAKVDILVSSTDSHDVLLSRETVAEATGSRNGSPLVIVDIAVPRDADPAVGDLPGVTLLDLDDLESVSSANREERAQEVAAVERIIDEEMLRFRSWWESRSLDPSIARLEAQAEALRTGEVAKTLRQMPHLGEDEAARIEAMSRAIVRKLLHNPIAALKEDPGQLEAARQLFGLKDEPGAD